MKRQFEIVTILKLSKNHYPVGNAIQLRTTGHRRFGRACNSTPEIPSPSKQKLGTGRHFLTNLYSVPPQASHIITGELFSIYYVCNKDTFYIQRDFPTRALNLPRTSKSSR